jgi:5'-deoxynucleotidase YfbR-like HD superfamily hydrolase
VAEHSVLVVTLGRRSDLSPEFNLALLMHDAAEAYIGDIISPVKRLLAPRSNELEDLWLAAIEKKFNLEDRLTNMGEAIHKADRLALSIEISNLFHPVNSEWWTKFDKPTKNQLLTEIHCYSPADARRHFIENYRALDSARTP